MQTPAKEVEHSATTLDANLRERVDAYAAQDAEYWSFRGNAAREHSHGYFQYPAMMVPEMICDLIRTIIEVKPSVKAIYDPFAGSGTVLTEAMLQGRDFLARDINPLAILLCKAKAGPFFPDSLREKARELQDRMARDTKDAIAIGFPGRAKWFSEAVAVELSKIKRAILREPAIWARRFFWIALAETVRTTSNSRTSTFKLHIRPPDEIAGREVNPTQAFAQVLDENLDSLNALTCELAERKHLNHGRYRGKVVVELRDAQKADESDTADFDLLVTSPPYGDNVTTVPYGQHAFLPLQWIELSDVDPAATEDYLKTTHEIDARSLGGSRRDALAATSDLGDVSPSFRSTIDALAGEPPDRAVRVAAFIRDLDACLNPILAMLRKNAYLIWTVGNRNVAKRPVPLDSILTELLAHRKVLPVATAKRDIPTKRMALKNNITATMGKELILVFRKEGD